MYFVFDNEDYFIQWLVTNDNILCFLISFGKDSTALVASFNGSEIENCQIKK